MTRIVQVAVILNNGLTWQFTVTGMYYSNRKCFFLSSEIEKTQLKHHTQTEQSMEMMENFQTQNDTQGIVTQWVSWNKSFKTTGCFSFEQIKFEL